MIISFFSSVDGGNIVEGAAAGLVAGLTIGGLRAWREYRKEKGHIKYIRRELKDLKGFSDDICGEGEKLDYSEEVYRCEMYDNMRRKINPVLNRLSYKKRSELNQALDWAYLDWGDRVDLLTGEGGRPTRIVEGQWPTGSIYKHDIDKIFKKLEGLKWLKINK